MRKIAVYFYSMAPAGGIERVISKHIHFLSKKYEVILITNDSKESFYKLPEKLKHYRLDSNMHLNMNLSRLKRILILLKNSRATIDGLRKIYKKEKIELFYVASPYTLLLLFLSSFPLNKIIVTEHSSFKAYNKVYKLIIRFFYSRVGLLTVPTTMDSDFYLSKKIKNEYLPNPLSFRTKEKSSLKNKIVLHVARFTNDKQHEVLVRIWEKVHKKNKEWKLIMIGDGENKHKIKELISLLDLNDSIEIKPSTKRIKDEFIRASIFCLTSKAEGFGLVLTEAMVCGIPCASFNCPSGPRDIINDGHNGYLIDNFDEVVFCKKLDLLMNNEGLRKEMGLNAVMSVSKFQEENISKRFLTLIENKI